MSYNPHKNPDHPLLQVPANPLWAWEEDMRDKLSGLSIRGEKVNPVLEGVFVHQATLMARWRLTDEVFFDIPWPEDDIFRVRMREFVLTSKLIGDLDDVRITTPSSIYASLVSRHVAWIARNRKSLDYSDTANKVFGRIVHLELFQSLDNINATSIYSHKRRVYNPSKSSRDIIESFKGRLCPIETPESTKIGLALHLANEARVDREGYVLAPFKLDGDLVYLRASEERRLREEGRDLTLFWPDAIFSRATSQVPLISVNDPNRVLMGTNHIKQALPPVKAEPPIVRTGYELEDYGVNLLVAYAHYKGITYEDAVVLSETAAKKLTSASYKLLESKITRREILIPEHYELPHLSKDGIVRPGTMVREFDILVAKAQKLESSELASLANIPNVDGYAPNPTVVPRFTSGKVESVDIIEAPRRHIKRMILIKIKSISEAREGDKIAGRYGNKGIIGAVLPDDKMPRLPDGRPVELIISPSSVVSRMNLGQLVETQLSWVLKEYGEKDEKALDVIIDELGGAVRREPSGGYYIEAPHFGGFGVQNILNIYERLGLPDKLDLYDPVEGRTLGKAVVGYQYILRLAHLATGKLSGRSTGPTDYLDMPTGGRSRRGGQRIGEMEGWALKAHGAAHLYRELRAVRSDSYGGRIKAEMDIDAGNPIHVEDYDGLTGISVAYLMAALAASGFAVDIGEDD